MGKHQEINQSPLEGEENPAEAAPSQTPWFERPLINRSNRLLWIAILSAALLFFIATLPRQPLISFVSNLFANRLLVFLALLFGLTSVSLLFSAGQRLDARVFLYLNLRGARPRWLDWLMWIFTQFGNGFLAMSTAAILYLRSQRLLAIRMILGILTLWLLVETIKAIVDRTRPYLALEESRVVGLRITSRSYPSGHSSQIFFLASLMIYHFELALLPGLGLYAIAAFVGFTRVYMGVHYPRDVLAGALLGVVWGILSVLTTPYFGNFGF